MPLGLTISICTAHTQHPQLLAKTPPGGKGISDGDLFAANPNFSYPKRFFALQLPDVTRAHNPARLEVRGVVLLEFFLNLLNQHGFD